MKVLVTGSSGLIGSALRPALVAEGHEVVRLVRATPDSATGDRQWDPLAARMPEGIVDGFDAIVHLAGASIGGARWSASHRAAMTVSRVDATTLLANALAAASRRPSVMVSASAIGIYGDRGDEVLNEESGTAAGDFLSALAHQWEAAAAPAAKAGIRVVHPRTGIVLSRTGGALQKLLLPFKLGAGGRLGSGKQWWSWISLRDEVRAILHLLQSDLAGPVNLTAPHPVTNAAFSKTLGKVMGRPSILPAPRFALRALFGKDMADVLLFSSARVLPQRLLDDGFEFQDADLDGGLRAALA